MCDEVYRTIYNRSVPPPRFFAPALTASSRAIVLPAEEAHHLTRVLRLGLDDVVAVFDGRGGEWLARVAAMGRDEVMLELGETVTPVAEPPVAVTLAVGLLKGDQMDDVIRDATMMGVRAIAPMATAHVTVPERSWKGTRAIDRWHRVAVASAKQCRRAIVPEIQAVRTLEQVIGGAGESDARLICLEPALQDSMEGRVFKPAPARHRVPSTALVLVGPEGGWSNAEVSVAAAAGCEALVLGPRTIRAERAPLVALSALWSHWGW
jgi:16S rRNA (uracil1498-N3)-methyltransferase